MASIDLKDATITAKDGGANTAVLVIGTGSLSWTESQQMDYRLDRGKLYDVRKGDEVPLELTMSGHWEYQKSSGDVPFEDAIKGTNTASDWVSSDEDVCRPYAIDIEIEFTPECSGDVDVEALYVFPAFRWESLTFNANDGTIEMSGKCNVQSPTLTRTGVTTPDPPVSGSSGG